MSLALGGSVGLSEHAEIGWSQLETIGDLGVRWFGEQDTVSLFQWHGDSFSIPKDAVEVMRGNYCNNQTFVVNDMHLGMQFHCEVDSFKIRLWVDRDAHEIENSANSPAVQKIANILSNLHEDVLKSQTIATHIYDTWSQKLKK